MQTVEAAVLQQLTRRLVNMATQPQPHDVLSEALILIIVIRAQSSRMGLAYALDAPRDLQACGVS